MLFLYDIKTYKRNNAKFGQIVLSRASVYFAFSKLTLSFLYSFHVPCTILSNVYFYPVFFMLPFLFNRSETKAGIVVNLLGHPCFRKRATIGQLNTQATAAESRCCC